eukprot:scaffold2860_cov106-Isochrysis_galbana.AAC.7
MADRMAHESAASPPSAPYCMAKWQAVLFVGATDPTESRCTVAPSFSSSSTTLRLPSLVAVSSAVSDSALSASICAPFWSASLASSTASW